ncbi:hypothetical protein NE865_07254 [Phthorimaea operculella]|nr:hypothetical protein NE865_07254 [Phthorimaea operculella]
MKNTALAQSKFKCFIPSYNVTRLGVVKGIPTEFSEEDIIENIILPYGYNGKIIKARRLKHRKLDVATRTVSRLDSETVVLTFDGQKTPERVYFMHNSLLVDQYNFPVIQCYKCCRYGHTMVQCRSRARCFKCAEEHSGDTCGITTEKSKCVFCSAAHFATNNVCPEYIRQVNIKSTMGKEGISFQEAAKMFAPARRLYSSAAKTIIQPSLQSASLTSQETNNQNESSQFSPQIPHSTSYRKTVVKSRKPIAPLQPSYDQRAHQEIINDFTAPPPQNGCGYPSQSLPLNNLRLTRLLAY